MPLDESCLQSYSDRKANHSNSGRKISKFFGITDNSIDEANHNNNSNNNNNNNNNTSDKTSKAIKIFGLNDNEINKKFKSNHRGSSSNNSNEIGGLIIVASIRKHVVCKGYLSKHTNTNFVLSKSWKKRYFILARNILYCFKSSDQTSALVDNFELTSDTIVCVSDAFNGKSWILEVSKLNVKPWYLQADNVNEMKSWLRELKSIVVKLKYRIPKSPSDSANTSTVSINLTDNDENDNNDNISIDDKSVSSINNNKKNKVINGTNNSSNTSVNNIGSNCSITTNAISSLISESHEEDEFFTPKTSVSDRSSILSGTSDDSDEIMQASLLPPPRPIMTSLPPPPRPKSTQPVLLSPSSPTKTSRTFMPSSVPLAPHTMSNIMMIKEEEISEISDDDESKQPREFTKRSASPVESLSPPATNNLSPSIIKTTMTLEQRRRSNSFKSLRVNVLSNNNNNNNNNSVNNSAQLTKNLADSNDPDKRNRNRQNSPIVMPSWSVRSISTNTMTTPTNTDTTNTASAASNDNNVINDNVSKNTITTPINHHVLSQQTRITTPLSPQNFQNLNSPSKSGNAKITTSSSSSSPIGNKKSPINNKGIDFIVSPTDNNNNHDIPSSSTQQQQSPQKTRQRGNKNRTKPKIRLPNDLSASVSSTTSGDDKIQNNGVKSHPQSSSSSSSSLSSSPTMSPSSTVSPSSSLPPPTPPTPFNLLYRNRNYQSSFMDLPVTPVSHSLPARSKSYSNLRKSSMTSLNTFDLSSLPPPTQPPNAPLPPIPQQEPVPQPQAPPQLQKESKAKFSSHTLPSSTSKTISEKLKRSPLKNSKETEDCIDSDRSKQLAASRKNNKKLGKVGKNEIEETTGSHTDRDKIDNGIRKNAINFPVSGLAFVMVEETNGNGETILDLQDINEINNNNNGSNNKGNNNVTIIKTEEIKNP